MKLVVKVFPMRTTTLKERVFVVDENKSVYDGILAKPIFIYLDNRYLQNRKKN